MSSTKYLQNNKFPNSLLAKGREPSDSAIPDGSRAVDLV